ncbi:type I secretion system permease/ATPase [Azospirillum sp.]|uniref:type I secretion system permease/ATPase n=1 Tax=Azospirillum sp. TaxID=34012 RepID=UPI002D6D9CDB|nr:type I secretion system permease/ATPase [Azospirillum sp.]HYD70461.1 type I secretion system permease/ATPase [Azospirillum sp.]
MQQGFLRGLAPELAAGLRACLPHFGATFGFSFVINILFMTYPIYMMQVYNRVLPGRSEASLLFLTLIAGLACVTYAGLDVIRMRLLVRSSLRLDRRLSLPVFLTALDAAARQPEAGRGQVLRDLDTFRQFVTSQGIHALFEVPWIPLSIIAVWFIHPAVGLFTLAAAALMVALAIVNELITRRPLEAANDRAAQNYAFTDTCLRNADVARAMGMAPGIARVWQKSRHDLIWYQTVASEGAVWITATIRFLRLFLQICSLGVGAFLVMGSDLPVGAMYAVVILLGRALAPVDMAVAAWRSFAQARYAFRRVNEVFLIAPARPRAMPLPRPEGHLSVERLIYAPPGGDRPILKSVSFAVGAGQVLGLIGPSGAGKSTLARHLVGSLKPTSGTVRLDGADVWAWDREDFGPHVGYLPQDIELFAGTVRDNIDRFSQADPAEVVDAARRAGVHEMILRLPQGYDTEIQALAGILSGGERQRLGLARALFGDPRLLVLDEPNSNLDNEGEQALLAALVELKSRGATIVVISHRPAVLQVVDQVLVLRDGQIEAFGPREDVLKNYQKIVRPLAFGGPGKGAPVT